MSKVYWIAKEFAPTLDDPIDLVKRRHVVTWVDRKQYRLLALWDIGWCVEQVRHSVDNLLLLSINEEITESNETIFTDVEPIPKDNFKELLAS